MNPSSELQVYVSSRVIPLCFRLGRLLISAVNCSVYLTPYVYEPHFYQMNTGCSDDRGDTDLGTFPLLLELLESKDDNSN